MSVVQYVINKKLDDSRNYVRSVKELETNNSNLNNSQNIHIVLIDSCEDRIRNRKDILKNKITKLLEELVKTDSNDHLLLVIYGYNIRIVTPVLTINDSIITPISHISYYNYDFWDYVTRKIAFDAIESRSILTNPEFSFLEKYKNILIHEIF